MRERKREREGERQRLESLSHGRMLCVGGGEREPEDQRGDREAAAERQEGLSQGAEAAAVR